VDGHRRYADEPGQPSWYPGQSAPEGQNRYANSSNPYDSGVYERPSGAFRLPDQRPAEAYATDPLTSTGSHARPAGEPSRLPVRGPEYPAVRPQNATPVPEAPVQVDAAAPLSSSATASGYNEPTSLVPPVPAPERSRDAVYGARRPVSAVLVAVSTIVLMVPVVRLLLQATFAHDAAAGSIVPAVLLMLGLPLTGVGLYALARGGRPHARDMWLHPPVAYLPAGLFLVLAAALAVS